MHAAMRRLAAATRKVNAAEEKLEQFHRHNNYDPMDAAKNHILSEIAEACEEMDAAFRDAYRDMNTTYVPLQRHRMMQGVPVRVRYLQGDGTVTAIDTTDDELPPYRVTYENGQSEWLFPQDMERR